MSAGAARPGDDLELIARAPDPGAPARPTPLLFVHGAWHAAWCWDEHFLPYFAAHGYRAAALSLRGHGASPGARRLRTARIAGYVADVARVAARLDPAPVVIGHSMGGLVVQRYLETHAAPAAVLLASVPPRGVLRATLNIARKHPLRFLRANATWSLYPLVATPRLVREQFFAPALPDDRLATYAARVQDEAYLAFIDMLALALPRPRRVKAPVLVLGGARDAIFIPREVRRTARAYHAEATIFPGVAHDLMLDPGWEQVAERILGWLQARGI